MVDIDLGQSVRVGRKEVVPFLRTIAFLDKKNMAAAANSARMFMVFDTAAAEARFAEELGKQQVRSEDPFEILTRTIEETELEGITLKPEYLFFQKLFATLVGLKRSIGQKDYIMAQTKKLFALHWLAAPRHCSALLRDLQAEPEREALEWKMPAAGSRR